MNESSNHPQHLPTFGDFFVAALAGKTERQAPLDAMLDNVSHSARILGQVEAAKFDAPKDHPLRHIPDDCFDHLKSEEHEDK